MDLPSHTRDKAAVQTVGGGRLKCTKKIKSGFFCRKCRGNSFFLFFLQGKTIIREYYASLQDHFQDAITARHPHLEKKKVQFH